MLKHLFLILSVLAYTAVSLAEPRLSSDAPEDKPFSATDEQFKRIDEAIAPYVKKARDTFPQAKERFLDGLPAGEIFS